MESEQTYKITVLFSSLPITFPDLRRIDSGKKRFYAERSPYGGLSFYPSWTTVLDAVVPISPYLKDWYKNTSPEMIEERSEEAKQYGTLLHICIADYIQYGRFDTTEARKSLQAFLKPYQVEEKFQLLCKSVTGFIAFAKEKQLEVEAVEVPLVDREWRIAGTIDIVGTMVFNRKRVRAIIDIKSSKQTNEHYELQLHGYMNMWNKNYPDYPATMVFNWLPTDWKTEPTYKLENQTDKPTKDDLCHYCMLANNKKELRPGKRTIWNPVITPNADWLHKEVEPEVFYSTLFNEE